MTLHHDYEKVVLVHFDEKVERSASCREAPERLSERHARDRLLEMVQHGV